MNLWWNCTISTFRKKAVSDKNGWEIKGSCISSFYADILSFRVISKNLEKLQVNP